MIIVVTDDARSKISSRRDQLKEKDWNLPDHDHQTPLRSLCSLSKGSISKDKYGISNELDIIGDPAMTCLHKCSCACRPSSVRSSKTIYLNIESENPSLWKVLSPNLPSSLVWPENVHVTRRARRAVLWLVNVKSCDRIPSFDWSMRGRRDEHAGARQMSRLSRIREHYLQDALLLVRKPTDTHSFS